MSTEREALAELVACCTEPAGWDVGMLADRQRFNEMFARSNDRLEAALDAARAALAQPAVQGEPVAFSEPVVLPDGSAFAVASWPLPKDHWLYAPRSEWDSKRDEYSECPHPVLNHQEHRQAVIAALRYAIRGATMCGQEMDFDPDALVQNACYALCGPFNSPPSQPPRELLTLSDEQLDRVRGKLGAAASMLSGKTLREIARAVLAAQEQKT